MRLPGPLCVTTALPSDPGTRNVGHTISPVERHAHLVHGRSPSNQRQHKPEPPRSILEISAGNPFKKYPETLSVSPDLIKLLQDLQRDNKVGKDVIERAAIITRTGVLYPLSKERHIEILGGRVQNAWETSPRAVEVHKSKLASRNHFLTAVLKGQKEFLLGDEDELRKVDGVRLAKAGADQPR